MINLRCVCLTTFVAAVSRVPGEPLVIEEIFVAPPMPREVRIQIIFTSPSNTDIAFWKMKVVYGFYAVFLFVYLVGFKLIIFLFMLL